MGAKQSPRPKAATLEIGPAEVHAYLRRIPGQWRSAIQLCNQFKIPTTDINRGNMVCNCAHLEGREKIESGHNPETPRGPLLWRVRPEPEKRL